jgi:hypothetical protein
MLKALALKFSALTILVLVVGVIFTMALTYFIVGMVQVTSFLIELISRGGYG